MQTRWRFRSLGSRTAARAEPVSRRSIDLVEMRLLTFTPESQGAEVVAGEMPAELHDEAELWREQMLEQLFDYSNELAELVLEKSPCRRS